MPTGGNLYICDYHILQKCPDAEVLLVGNKSDLDSERVISKVRGQHLASSLGISFREISPKSDIASVDEVSGVWVYIVSLTTPYFCFSGI